ncbi:fungal-specific transcription factor domain-containing protein [Aspergillus nidulans var. acristatus]
MGTPATKACHNCRRRRLKCDRAVPSCAKCFLTGQECLGYGKLFLWNQGVASRGKMMGKTFPVPGSESGSVSVSLPEPHGQKKEATTVPSQDELVYTGPGFSVSGLLLDPLYQSLDESSRRYLFHFATSVCSDLAIADATEANPFRRLVPLCRDYPILQHAINAAGALHISCLHRRTRDPCDADRPVQPRHTFASDPTDPSSRALIDALLAKQRALALLRQALEDVSTIDVDLSIAVVHLFIIFELLSPGGDEWRAHVQGALRLISYLQTLTPRRASPAALIRDTVTSDCLTWYILGSTLMKTTTLSDPFLLSGDIFASLTRAETTSYISLPTTLLHILFRACELSNLVSVSTMLTDPNTDYSGILSQAHALLQMTKAFDAHAWAFSLERSSDSARTLSRIHTALAHQNALLTYICRSVDSIVSPTALGESTETLVTNIVTHLSFVGSTDPVFVATTWPTFIAGAETDNPVYRRWAVDRLAEFWSLMPWGYVRTAIEAMETTWRLRDEAGARGRAGGGLKRESWIQQLKELEKYWLIA